MKYLIIPDLHQRCKVTEKILERESSKVDKIVFLGDYFDNFDGAWESCGFKYTCEWIKPTHDSLKEKAIWLIGNHDMCYLEECFRHSNFPLKEEHPNKIYKCTGYTRNKASQCRKFFHKDKHPFFLNTHLIYQAESYLLSHAGIHPSRMPMPLHDINKNIEKIKELWEDTKLHINIKPNHNLLTCGQVRGGNETVGGITWLDFDCEFVDIENVPQIVGHSHHPKPERKGRSIDIDCCNAFYIKIEDFYFDVYTLNGEIWDESTNI